MPRIDLHGWLRNSTLDLGVSTYRQIPVPTINLLNYPTPQDVWVLRLIIIACEEDTISTLLPMPLGRTHLPLRDDNRSRDILSQTNFPMETGPSDNGSLHWTCFAV